MNTQKVIKFIDSQLHFYFDESFEEHVAKFGIQENELKAWHLISKVFESLDISELERERKLIIYNLVEESVNDYLASLFLGEPEIIDPDDIGTELGIERQNYIEVIKSIPQLIFEHRNLVSNYFG
ncbi:hypothetical protein [Aliiglaciecola sp. M165]|uniref:hypothetical protein n=1 Tax=Aliiglaciecola sp. M165 TaxID=2593649 RepID=UPI00117D174D|nr:hypothetical protein [Aliiglaciecola sp. M165]TRY30324.1 hypothetical protein FM019_16055 [Aliiglaciecola sp. M165]